METTVAYPIWYTLAIVTFINLVVLALTYTLFNRLQSSAKIQTRKWAAGGAIAGFLILTALELRLIDHFSPSSFTSRPSYEVVHSFYNDLQFKRYDDAWKRLHPNFQNNPNWRGNVEIFKSGYKDTVGIYLLAIELETVGSPASDNYVVYYNDQVSSPIIPGLDQLSSRQLKDIDAVTGAVHELRKQLDANGFDVDIFDSISFYDLVAPNRAIRIGWRLESKEYSTPPLKKFDQLFPQRKSVSFISSFHVVTQNTETGWKILSMVPVALKE
jgi:hypothetical protein